MKIAICSENNSVDSLISNAVGRAPYFLIFKDNKLIKSIKNPFALGGGGAGFSVAKLMQKEEVNMIIGKRFGPNVIQALKDRNINFKITNVNIVKDAL